MPRPPAQPPAPNLSSVSVKLASPGLSWRFPQRPLHAVTMSELPSFFKDLIYLFLQRGEGREKERKKNIIVWSPLTCPLLGTWPATQACALTGNRTSDPLVHRPALNPLSHTSQGRTSLFLRLNNIPWFGGAMCRDVIPC